MQQLFAGLHTVHRRGNPISPPLSPHKHGMPSSSSAPSCQASPGKPGPFGLSGRQRQDPTRAIALYNATKGLLGGRPRLPYLEPLSVCTYWDMSQTLASARDTWIISAGLYLRGRRRGPSRGTACSKPDKKARVLISLGFLARVEIIRQSEVPYRMACSCKRGREGKERKREKLFRPSADRAHITYRTVPTVCIRTASSSQWRDMRCDGEVLKVACLACLVYLPTEPALFLGMCLEHTKSQPPGTGRRCKQ